MVIFTRPRLIALLSLVVFTSGWIELPVPKSWLEREFEFDGQRVRVQADTAHVNWARGRIEAANVRIQIEGKQVLLAPQARIHFGMLPFTRNFRKPWLLELGGPQIELDEKLIRRLSDSSSPQAGDLPVLSFRVQGGRLVWSAANGQIFAWEVEDLSGSLSPQRSDVALRGRMLEPIQSSVRAKASALEGMESWWFQLEGENASEADAARPQRIDELRGIEVRPGQYSFRLAAQQEPGQEVRSDLQLSLQHASAEIADPPLHLSEIQLHASGGMREGVRTEISALVDEDFQVLAQGRMQWPKSGDAWLSLRGDSTTVLVDQDRLDWVRLLHPVTAEILEALEVRGGPEARFAIDWRKGEQLGWAVHADTSGMQMRYRGIVTDTGEKPAFPYPIRSTRGDFVAAGRWLMMDVEGQAGVGSIEGHGVIEVRPDDTGVYLDIAARGVAVDREIRAAATGTPEIIELWRQLGIPLGGTTDVDVRLRSDYARETMGITIGGVGRGVAVRPQEMPIPLILDEVEFFWTIGYASFDAQAQSPVGPLRVYGEMRACEGEEYPGVRAILTSVDPSPDLRTRRTLVERLELPSFLSQFALAGRSSIRLEYNQAATAEAAQYLFGVQASDMDLDWGTALGTRFVPFVGVEHLRGSFELAGSEDTHSFIAPDLNAEFSGRAVQAAMDGGSDEDGGLIATSRGLQLPAPAAAALVRLLQLDKVLGQLQVDATSDLTLEWRNNRSDPLACKLQLQPLRLRLPDSETPLELYGEIVIADGRLEASSFRLVQGDGWIEVDDLVFYFGADRQEMSAVLDSARGIELGPQLFQLLGPDAAQALSALGVAGEIGPRGVELVYVNDETEPASLTVRSGEILLDHFRSTGPPMVEEGAARIVIESFKWIEGEGVHAVLQLNDGRAVVSEVPVRGAFARLVIEPDRIRLEGLEAQALGGWVRSRSPQAEGQEAGGLSLGLVPGVPVEAQIEFGDLQLAQLQDQLNLDAGARGVLRGWLEIQSPTLDVLDYVGSGRLDIEEGRLTTVPILKQIWGALGIDPPVFREGTVKFRMGGDTRVRIEQFELRHDLLNVEGKGWIHLDGFVQLKVSLRRVMLLLGLPITDLPLLSQFFDLFIEQEVFGPIDRLQLAPRSVRKILGRELPKVPKPLWIPTPERRPRGSSPIFPLHGDPAGG
jgi:hypothetical protein